MKITKILGIATIALAAIAVLSLVFKVIGPTKDYKDMIDAANKLADLHGGDKQEAKTLFGFETIFGAKIFGDEVVEFGILPLLFFLVGIGGLVTAVLSFLGKGPKQLKFVTAGCLVVFAIGLFIMPNIVTLKDGIERDMFKEMFTVGWGAWIGGIAAILGAGAAVAGAVVKE